ncbi:hypothetical protein COCON_G00001500 [Conger conger]|uniref:5-hydroxytryptamine receptor 1D n=1 Tax=Conger conger TaxID=82655 RepID=A0A9Q1I858_CONCO|nr:hypothetical protein COCON_G00001500 [Conger conger]
MGDSWPPAFGRSIIDWPERPVSPRVSVSDGGQDLHCVSDGSQWLFPEKLISRRTDQSGTHLTDPVKALRQIRQTHEPHLGRTRLTPVSLTNDQSETSCGSFPALFLNSQPIGAIRLGKTSQARHPAQLRSRRGSAPTLKLEVLRDSVGVSGMDLGNGTEDQFFGNATEETPGDPVPSWDKTTLLGLQISLSAFLAVVTLATVLSNAFVITTIFLTRKLHTPANFLIGSLAVTDLLVSILVMPISIVYTVSKTWSLGQIFCDVWLSSDITFCTASILHLCVIALDRYWAITDALEYSKRRTTRRAAVMIAVVWVISISISMPPLFWRQAKAHEELTECMVNTDQISYTLYSTFGAFYVPTVLLVILYGRIYVAARSRIFKTPASRGKRFTTAQLIQTSAGSSLCSINSAAAQEVKLADSVLERKRICAARERKATKTLGIILGAFIVCWLPFFVGTLVTAICKDCWFDPVLFDVFTWLGYLNSLINPVIYTAFNDEFKQAFQKLIKFKRCY